METSDSAAPENQIKEMSLMGHLGELRVRLAYSFAAVIVAGIVAYFFAGTVFRILSAPYMASFAGAGLDGAVSPDLVGTGPAEAFLLKIKAAVFVGVLLASPVIFYQLWLFVAPGLHAHERRWVIPFLAGTTGLFLIGVLFSYYAVFPLAFKFFSDEYASIGIKPVIKIDEYLTLVIQVMLAFGLVFEIPMLALFLARFGIIDHKMLLRWWRPAIVLIFVAAAILTPPDVISQFLLAIPLMVLYGLSILIAKHAYRPRGSVVK